MYRFIILTLFLGHFGLATPSTAEERQAPPSLEALELIVEEASRLLDADDELERKMMEIGVSETYLTELLNDRRSGTELMVPLIALLDDTLKETDKAVSDWALGCSDAISCHDATLVVQLYAFTRLDVYLAKADLERRIMWQKMLDHTETALDPTL